MKNKVGIVYQWINIENNKYYIGSHFGYLNDGYISSGKIFQQEYALHKNKMMRIILYIGEDFRKVEEFYLKYIDVAKDMQSYNMKNSVLWGGVPVNKLSLETRAKISEALRKRVRKPMTQEQKQKISQTLTGRKLPIEYCEKRRINSLGGKNPFYGKKHTDETKLKISLANKGKLAIPFEDMKKLHEKAKKKIYSEIDKIMFNCYRECAEYYKLHPCSISNMIAGRCRNKYGLTTNFENISPYCVIS